MAQQAVLIDALAELEPLHREHVWKPSRKFAPKAVRDLNRAAKKFELSRSTTRAL